MRRRAWPVGIVVRGCFLILVLAGCRMDSALIAATATTTTRIVTTDSSEGIIFAAASAEQMSLETLVHETIDGDWTPSREDVLAFEQRLGFYLGHAAPLTYPGPLRELSAYRRQYIGIMVSRQRVIFVNFFCDALDTDWHREMAVVLDGGACFFEIKYDVQIDAYYDLSIHGEA